MMADLFDFPSVTTEPDPLPYPDEPYQAFDRTGNERFPMLTLILAQDSMVGYRFSDIEKMDFTPAHAPDGLDVLNLQFAWSWATPLATVRIEGRNSLISPITLASNPHAGFACCLPASRSKTRQCR
jgi:hypothetical protein